MNGKEAIIARILEDAENTAREMIEEAELRSSTLIAVATGEAEDYRIEQLRGVKKEKEEIVKRREILARLDVKKQILNAKQAIIDKVFSDALSALAALNKADYGQIVTSMLTNAEDGDTVIIANAAKDIITESFIEAYAKEHKIKLDYSISHEFVGGIILANKHVDKNLTFEVELNAMRKDIEAEIAFKLFK